MVSLKHKFQSPLPDSSNPSLIRPSNWNDDHDLILTQTGVVLGRKSADGGSVEELSAADLSALIGGPFLAALVDDTSPQLGGDLDLNGHNITGTGNVSITGNVTATNVSGTNTGDQTSVTGNAGTATKLATARNIDGQSFDGSADITVIAPGTHAATGKTTPVDADELALVDSAASNVLKKLTWANLKATLKTYFDTLYQPLNATLTSWAGKTVPSGTVVGTTDSQTLTNKILTSPAITTPTGIVKGDVGLGNVDNTSDATKNSAIATLTNKTLTNAIVGTQTAGDNSTKAASTAYVDTKTAFNNRCINPLGQWMQAGVGSTADGSYSGFDQWYCLSQTATVTTSQLTDVEDGMPFAMRITQAQSTAQRFGFAQVFESAFSKDMRSKTAVVGARVRCSASTTLRFAILGWTGTADAPTKDVVNDWTSSTFTAGNFFLSSNVNVVATGSLALTASTLANISLSGTFGSSLNNAIIMFWTDSTQAQNVTLDISKVWFGLGSVAPSVFDPPNADADLMRCYRYFYFFSAPTSGQRVAMGMGSGTTLYLVPFQLPVVMRAAPTFDGGTASNWTIATTSNIALTGIANVATTYIQSINCTIASGGTNGGAGQLRSAGSATMLFDARL